MVRGELRQEVGGGLADALAECLSVQELELDLQDCAAQNDDAVLALIVVTWQL